MKDSCAVSIGFPVYNVEKYVYNSLKSALEQDFSDYEILVIYDKSSDNSLDIVLNLIKTHPNGVKARIIKREKKEGLGEARNTAIRNARGKYIYFMDSDDTITANAISLQYEAAEKNNADVVYGSNFKSDGTKKWIEDSDLLPSLIWTGNQFTSYYYNSFNDFIPNTVWNILFNTNFLRENNLFFPKIKFSEDITFNELYHPHIKKVVFLPDTTYIYLLRNDSLMSRKERETISISEAHNAFIICKLMKSWLPRWEKKNFYSGKCAKIMKKCFYQVVGILKHRQKFTEPINDKEIRDMMKHPESLFFILSHRQLQKYNLFYYFLGILPPRLFIYVFNYICHKKGLY